MRYSVIVRSIIASLEFKLPKSTVVKANVLSCYELGAEEKWVKMKRFEAGKNCPKVGAIRKLIIIYN